jgi:hypothetical protein
MRTIKRFIYESLLKEALRDFTTELNGDQKECHVLENDDPIVLELNEIIKNLKSKNKISLDSVTKVIQMDDSVWYSAKIYGGVNGNGMWQSYLEDIKNLFTSIVQDVWLIDIENDVPDDVWTLRIGFRK